MYWYLILFLIVMFLLSQKEGFSAHDVYGPGDGGKSSSNGGNGGNGGGGKLTGSNLYDPNSPITGGKTSATSGPDSMGNAQPPPDNGSNSSDTTTQQNAIYFYKPFAMLPFPKADGPPVPFLNDFKVFQK